MTNKRTQTQAQNEKPKSGEILPKRRVHARLKRAPLSALLRFQTWRKTDAAWDRWRRLSENEIVTRFRSLALAIARQSTSKDAAAFYPGDDVEQAQISFALAGLLDAIRRGDPKRWRNFPSYAKIRIRGSVIDGIRAAAPLGKEYGRSRRAITDAGLSMDDPAGVAIIADLFGFSPKRLAASAKAFRTIDAIRNAVSLDVEGVAHSGKPDLTVADRIESARLVDTGGQDVAVEFAERAQSEALQVALDSLPSEHRRAVRLVVVERRPIDRTARALGIPPFRLGVQRTRGLAGLRAWYEARGISSVSQALGADIDCRDSKP